MSDAILADAFADLMVSPDTGLIAATGFPPNLLRPLIGLHNAFLLIHPGLIGNLDSRSPGSNP